MTMIEAIKAVLNATSSYGGANSARDTLHEIVAAYDALAPNWADAPDDAKLNTIDSAGARFWHRVEPSIIRLGWESGTATWAGFADIPIGLDWRLLKWQRPEVAA